MNKYQYAQEVCKYVNMKGYETIITDNSRNNAAFVGITVRSSKDDKVSPVFNINGEETLTPEEFANYILSFIPDEINIDEVTRIMQDREEILSRSCYILVNSKLNESRGSLVRKPINETLELQYKIDISDVMKGARVSVESKHLDLLGISEQELYENTYINTMVKNPPRLANISTMLPIELEGELPMYVLTNTSNVYGAGAILYRGMRKLLEETVKGDFVVIPSSVHETIIIPKYLGDTYAITQMIREVNSSVVSPEDVLSDRPYELISDGVLLEV